MSTLPLKQSNVSVFCINNLLCRLQQIEGDWHEFESKALRRENERKEREARKAAEKGARDSGSRDNKDSKKRPPESNEAHRESKRQHVEKAAETASKAEA